MVMLAILILLQLICVCYSSSYSFAGVFHLDDSTEKLVLSAEKVEDAYAHNTMRIVFLEATEETDDAIDALDASADTYFGSSYTNISSLTADSSSPLLSKDTLYQLSFDNDVWLSVFNVQLETIDSSEKYWAVFADRDVFEFQTSDDDHPTLLKETSGHPVEVHVYGEDEHGDEHGGATSENWINVIGACTLVWLCTFAGLIFVVFPGAIGTDKTITSYFNSFSAGALLSTAFSLVLGEALHMISEGTSSESEASAFWSSMVIFGFLASSIMDIIIQFMLESKILVVKADSYITRLIIEGEEGNNSNSNIGKGKDNDKDKGRDIIVYAMKEDPENNDGAANNGDINSGGEAEAKAVELETSRQARCLDLTRLISSVVMGDFFHNFCDGIFIGAAFQSCSPAVAWVVTMSTVTHEFTQEIADFIILRTMGKLSVKSTLQINFASGISVILGGIVVLLTSLSPFQIGCFLAFGAGNYMFVATVEIMPGIFGHNHSAHTHRSIHIQSNGDLGDLKAATNSESDSPIPTTTVSTATDSTDTATSTITTPTATVAAAPPTTTTAATTKVPVKQKVVRLACFLVAVVAVSLVLLDHTHCSLSAGEGEDAHASH
jgi:zinc transporter ZupT